MVQVAVSAEFLQAYAQVPRKVQKKVREFSKKFLEDPTAASINYERIHTIQDNKVRTVRVGIDYRAIVIHPPKGDVYTLVWVDNHDEAMAWAAKKRFEVNPVLGALQVYEIQDAGSIAAPEEELDGSTPLPEDRALAGRSQDELRRCGVPEPLLPSICACTTDEELDEIAPYLPADVSDTLRMLAAGYAVDEALQEVHEAAKGSVDVDDLASAIASPAARRHFKLIENEAEFEQLLAAPMEVTMTYASGGTRRALFDDEEDQTWPLHIEVDGKPIEPVLAPGASAVFGRHSSCDILLADPHVSRRQFRVTNIGNRLEVEGLPSKNRTHVVGRRAQDGIFHSAPDVLIRVASTEVRLKRQGD
jgi:mRNA-degrading endonuclease RelE of RelBE toxin-antitoxin system